MTPGGGGFGDPDTYKHEHVKNENDSKSCFVEKGSVYEYRKAQESV